MPGLVELHTDVLERHAFPRPGVRWPEEAAVELGGGVTKRVLRRSPVPVLVSRESGQRGA